MNILSKSYELNDLDRDVKNETLAINLVDCLINHIYKDFKNNVQYKNLFNNWNNCIDSIKDRIASHNERIKATLKSKDDEILGLQARIIEINANSGFELNRLREIFAVTDNENFSMKQRLNQLESDYQMLNNKLYDHQIMCNQQEQLIQSFQNKILDYEKRLNQISAVDSQNLNENDNQNLIHSINIDPQLPSTGSQNLSEVKREQHYHEDLPTSELSSKSNESIGYFYNIYYISN
jgi:hypothetical protein